jgi:hypothetical protein
VGEAGLGGRPAGRRRSLRRSSRCAAPHAALLPALPTSSLRAGVRVVVDHVHQRVDVPRLLAAARGVVLQVARRHLRATGAEQAARSQHPARKPSAAAAAAPGAPAAAAKVAHRPPEAPAAAATPQPPPAAPAAAQPLAPPSRSHQAADVSPHASRPTRVGPHSPGRRGRQSRPTRACPTTPACPLWPHTREAGARGACPSTRRTPPGCDRAHAESARCVAAWR